MKKADLEVGADYALGSTSRFDVWNAARGTLVQVDGTGVNRYGQKAKGLLFRFPDGQRGYGLPRVGPNETGLVESARWVLEPWATYAARKQAREASAAAAVKEAQRLSLVAEGVSQRLAALGLPEAPYSDGLMRLSPDAMARIVARVPA